MSTPPRVAGSPDGGELFIDDSSDQSATNGCCTDDMIGLLT